MTCHDYESALVDLSRGVAGDPETDAATRAHLEQCAACAARLRREETLTAGLRALATSTEAPAAADMEERLLERFDAGRAISARRAVRMQQWFAAAAALVMIAGLAATWRTARSRPDAATTRTLATEDEETGFVPWPGAAALPAFESGQLVRTELPASVLPLLGIARADAPAGGPVIADVLYGQDGLARAVRLVKQQSMQP